MNKQNGWAGIELADKVYAEVESEFRPFQVRGAGPSKPGPPIWRLARRVRGGKHIPCRNQQTGDCVSMGAANAVDYLTAAAIARGEPLEYHAAFAPYIYGVSRTAKDCGNGRLGRSAGSLGSWAVLAAKNHGILFEDDPDVPPYSGSVANTWGFKGVPEKFYAEAKDNLVRTASRLETVDQVREALINYFPVTIASSWGFRVKVVDGVKTYVPSGTWQHQMCWIAWRDDPFPAAFRLNSWGSSTGEPLDEEPIGGAWQRATDIARELKSGVEAFAWSAFDGFPAASAKYSFI